MGIRNEVPTTYGRKKGFPDLKRYQTLETGFKYIGEMSEWSMVQSWKGCVLKGTGGSNPPLSDKKEREYSCGGFETRSRRPWEEEGTEGGPGGANPPLSEKENK